MRTIVWFAYFWFTLLFLIPRLRKAQRAEAAGDSATRDAIVSASVTHWCQTLMKLAGLEVTVLGRENIPNDRPVVFVANHQGYFDIPLMLTSLDAPHGLIAKQAIQKLPLIRDWMALLGCVFIDRDNARQSVAGLNEAAKALEEQGRSFTIFPEGTRSQGGPLGEFKNGGFRVAFKSKAPIVPVCIDGSYKIMEANGYWIHPGKVTITILPPIFTEEMTREETKAVSASVRTMIAAHVAVKKQ
ncbi:MAG: lysophospholipid acyltransferase family protein [Angelakisella sp.]